MREKLLAYTMMAIVVLMGLLVWSPTTQAQGLPDYSINPEPPGQAVLDVRPGELGSDQVIINAENTGTVSITIELTTTCSGLVVSPTVVTVSLNVGDNRQIPITISALPKASLTKKTCLVSGRLVQVAGSPAPYDVPRNTAFEAAILQYARVSVSSTEPFTKIRPGQERPLNFKIENSGNYNDDYHLEVVNMKKLEDAGFSVTLAQNTLLGVDKDSYANVRITIQTPRGTVIGYQDEYFSLELKATSFIEGSRGDFRSAIVTVWVKGVFLPGFDPMFTISALAFVAVALSRLKKK